mgnify:CR=1 FL=1
MSQKTASQSAEIIQNNQDYTLFSWSKQKNTNPIAVKYAEGVYLYDYDDKRYIDFSSGLMNVNVGHGNQRVTEAVTRQMQEVAYVTPSCVTKVRGELGKKLAEICPGDLNKAFFTLCGATSIENAISEYERTLVSLDSKFDRNIRGDENSFTNDEKKGFNVFMSKGRCATCHYLPLFSGVVPPYYTRSEFEIIGTTSTADLKHPELDPDKGRGGLYGTEIFMHAFKTPSLRNIALTAPYMHNGAFENLKQVIDFYNKGGGNGLGLHVANQTLSPDSLHLSDKEINSLISFLNTLTDTSGMTAKPVHLPAMGDQHQNSRKTGGEY